MSFLTMLWTELSDLFSFFVTIAFLQNVVLTTSFGSSIMLHVVRKPKTIWLFTAMLTGFSVLTALIAYPLDRVCGTAITNFWRPLMIVGITVVQYIVAHLVLRRWFPTLYRRIGHSLHLAAFNNLVIGIALITNVQFTANLGATIGLSVGACLAFGLLTWITAEGIERLDNPDIPKAFRGMPATLVYIGLVALALMGFSSNFSLI